MGELLGPRTDPERGACALVAWNRAVTELVITEYDDRALLVRRNEWHDDPGTPRTRAATRITTDWDEQLVGRPRAGTMPDPPTDSVALAAVLDS